MMIKTLKAAMLATSILSLGGCAAVDMSDIEAAAPSIEACIGTGAPAAEGSVFAAAVATSAKEIESDARSGRLHFRRLSEQFANSAETSVRVAAMAYSPQKSEFAAFAEQAKSRADASVPASVLGNPVFMAVRDIMIKATANASMQKQLVTAHALGMPIAQADIDEVNAFEPKQTTFDHGDLKDFTKLLMTYGLHPTMQVSAGAVGVFTKTGGATATGTGTSFSKYFTAYYEGNFYDRLSVLVSKPTASLTITDAEIAAALTMLIEYVADLYDPTPVMTDGSGTYYPGGKKFEPTALATGLATSVTITGTAGCDWNTNDAPALGNLASAAADQAGAVGGMVSGTFGGWELGLGFLGKFSLGDNQTLSTVTKTFASRIAERATLASLYWALEKTKHSTNGPVLGAAPGNLVTYHLN